MLGVMRRAIICLSRYRPSGSGMRRTSRPSNRFSVIYALFVLAEIEDKSGIPPHSTYIRVGIKEEFLPMDPVSEIRQRRREEDEAEVVPKRSLTKRLEKLDFYPKIGDDYVVKTETGGYSIASDWNGAHT